MRTHREQTAMILEKAGRYKKAKKKRMGYVYSLSAVAACLVIAFVTFTLYPNIAQPGNDGDTIEQPGNDGDTTIGITMPEVYSQRLASVACQVDEWIYYAYGTDGIYKIQIDGTQHEKINDDYATFLQVHDGWLYYSCDNGEFVRAQLDGSDRTVLLRGIDAYGITVEGEWIYCTIDDRNDGIDIRYGGLQIIKMRIDGTEKVCLLSGFSEAVVAEDWIYYCQANWTTYEGGVYRIRKDGSEKTLIYADMAYNLILDGEYLYYHMERYENAYYDEDEGWGSAVIAESALCRIKTDGKNRSTLASNDITGQFFVQDGWIYYLTGGPYFVNHETFYEGAVYKVYFDGTQQQKLFETDVPLMNPTAAGDWVYFRLTNAEIDGNGNEVYTYSDADNINLYKVKKDGTEAQRVNLYGEDEDTSTQDEQPQDVTDYVSNYHHLGVEMISIRYPSVRKR
jgi:hypothetical protein